MNPGVPVGRRRHHYVPRFILDRFANTDGMLFVHDRQRPGEVRPQSPKDTFVEKHLYSTKERDGTRDRSLEILFCDLEGEVAPVVAKLIASARNRAAPALTNEERQIWDFYLSIQWRRVPEPHTSVIPEDTFEHMLNEAVEEYATAREGLTEKERQWVDDRGARLNFRQNVTVRSLRTGSGKVSSALGKRGLTLAVPDRPGKSFIISSRPVLRAGPGGSHWSTQRLKPGCHWRLTLQSPPTVATGTIGSPL